MRNYTDAGTYAFPEYGYNNNTAHREYLKDWIFDSTRWTVHGGEMVEDVPWTDGNRQGCTEAQAEMALIHHDYLNRDYGTPQINAWITNGCYDVIARSIGYRIALTSVTVPTGMAAGSSMFITLAMTNMGYGKVFNPRPIDLVFVGSGGPFTARVTGDARRDLPLGGSSVESMFTFNAPADLVSGQSYDLYLRLPDASTNLASDNRYAIRFANSGGVWDDSTGRHDLGMSVTVT